MSRIANQRTLRTMPSASLALCLVLGGCSSTSDQGIMFLADPGAFQFHNCEQLAGAANGINNRQKELDLLIAAASESVVGTALSVVAYRGEHRMNVENLALIERLSRTKNCTTATTWRSNAVIR
jgi:hypothetical protein